MDWRTAVLRCPACQGSLAGDEREVACTGCGTRYPVQFGVPLLSKGVTVEPRGERLSGAFVREMGRFLGSEGEATLAEVERCYGLRLSFGDPVLQTEADQFLNRLRSSGVSLPEPYEAPAFVPDGVTLGWLIPPRQVGCGQTFSVSTVVWNGSGRTLSSDGTYPFRLSYFWERDGIRMEGLRTPLLIDLGPARQISMPVVVQAPEAAGLYTLRVMPLVEGVTWIEALQITATIEVIASEEDPLAVTWERDPLARGYQEDHARAVELSRKWIAQHIASPDPVMMELGGNFHPMVQYLPGQRYNVDIDAFGLMTYNIREARSGEPPVRNIVSNGMNLPFPDDFLDVAMMFATFHHFPDPTALLRHIRTKLKPGGLVLLMCEPLGHVFRDTAPDEFFGELRRGVYEQSFMPWEYRDMLAAADLRIVEAALDTGSMKIAAQK